MGDEPQKKMGKDSSALSLQEALMMQLDEVELLETAYPEVTFDTPDARPLLRAVLDEYLERQHRLSHDSRNDEDELLSWLQAALAGAPLLSFRCPLPHRGARLRVRLPRDYPGTPLLATVEGTPQLAASVRKAIADAAASEASRLSADLRSEPQCLQVLGEAMRASGEAEAGSSLSCGESVPQGGPAAAALAAAGAGAESSGGFRSAGVKGAGEVSSLLRARPGASNRATSSDGPNAVEHVGKTVYLGRRLIYSHHIIAPQKRTGIVKAARELRLGGFSKVGWPGVIVIEGDEACCEDFVGLLRGWRWKHLAVRGEERHTLPAGTTLDQERLLPLPLEELGEKEGVSALAKRCREVGLDDLFSTLLR